MSDAAVNPGTDSIIPITVEGRYTFIQNNTVSVIRQNGQDRLPLLLGWRPTHIAKLSDDYAALILQSEAGGTACWYLNSDYQVISHGFHQLPQEAVESIRNASREAFLSYWNSFCKGFSNIDTLKSHDKLHLPEVVMSELANIFFHELNRKPENLIFLENFHSSSILYEQENCIIDVSFFRQTLSMPAQQWQDEVIENGFAKIRCFITGEERISCNSLILDPFTIVYVFAETERAPAIYIMLSGHLQKPIGFYIPKWNMEVYWSQPTKIDACRAIWFHIARYAKHVIKYLLSGQKKLHLVFRENHVGHILYNELEGAYRVVRKKLSHHVSAITFRTMTGTEMYGPIEALMPEYDCPIYRASNDLDCFIDHIYSKSGMYLRVTDYFVSADLAARIQAYSNQKFANSRTLICVEELKRRGALVVTIGLRVENRTWTRLVEGYIDLINRLAAEFSPLVVLIDGHNKASQKNDFVPSFNDNNGLAVKAEEEAVRAITKGTKGVIVIDMVGSNINENLTLIDASDFFVAPWGAGLAKYKWICNKNGVVFTSKANIAGRGDLVIYDSPSVRENVIPSIYLDGDFVTDLPESELLIAADDPGRWNFDIDEEMLYRLIKAEAEKVCYKRRG